MLHDWGRNKMRTELYLGDMKDRKRVVDLGVDGKIILKYILR